MWNAVVPLSDLFWDDWSKNGEWAENQDIGGPSYNNKINNGASTTSAYILFDDCMITLKEESILAFSHAFSDDIKCKTNISHEDEGNNNFI